MKRWLAWLMALMLAVPCGVAAQETNRREWAETLVTAFLESPYVDEPLDGRAVALTPPEVGKGLWTHVETEKIIRR